MTLLSRRSHSTLLAKPHSHWWTKLSMGYLHRCTRYTMAFFHRWAGWLHPHRWARWLHPHRWCRWNMHFHWCRSWFQFHWSSWRLLLFWLCYWRDILLYLWRRYQWQIWLCWFFFIAFFWAWFFFNLININIYSPPRLIEVFSLQWASSLVWCTHYILFRFLHW